jgi:hypothetical protein
VPPVGDVGGRCPTAYHMLSCKLIHSCRYRCWGPYSIIGNMILGVFQLRIGLCWIWCLTDPRSPQCRDHWWRRWCTELHV